jgi:hypothetical protein
MFVDRLGKLAVNVTNPELDALEDVPTVWNPCPSHRKAASRLNQRGIAALQYGGPKCRRLLQTRVDKSLQLWSKLCGTYDRES